jgi:outer membrane biosynthesis protein TonB
VRGTTLIFLVAGLLLAMPASAQTPEVQVDPNSPAGTEYAIPLDKARQDAAGDKGTSGKRGGKSEQLFGAGIEKQSEEPPPPPPAEATEAPEPVPAEPAEEEKSERPRKRSKDRPKKPSKEASNPSPTATSSEGDDSAPHKTAAAVDAASDDGSTGLVMGGIAVGVLGLGLLLGVGLRRLFRSA